MARFGWILCVVLCLAYFCKGQVSSICRPNERFLSCGGCQKTCKEPAPDCTAVCRTGCYCPDDQVRNDTGHCVPLSDCPPMAPHKLYTSEPHLEGCPDNEEYRFCEPCNRTCDNPNPVCPAQCARGCFCVEPLVRDRDGTCVHAEKCSTKRKNESSNFIRPPTPQFRPYQLTCGPHQVYNSCRLCENTCSSPTPLCRSTCSAGCFCEPGYLKSPSGECVRLEDCPRAEVMLGVQEPSVEDCSSDEIYLSCGWCEPSCWDPRPECPLGVCTRGCLCRPPLLRHHSGHCVEEKDCAPQKCSDPNEEFVCRYGCEARCGSTKCNIRPRRCMLGCHCKLGLLRDVTGKCVVPENCLNTNITNSRYKVPNADVAFIPNKDKPRFKSIFDEDSESTEDSRETFISVHHYYTGKAHVNENIQRIARNITTPLSIPLSHLGVFPLVYEKSVNNKRFFGELPFNYSNKFDTTIPKIVDNTSKKSSHQNAELVSTTSANIANTNNISKVTEEIILLNDTKKHPTYPSLSEEPQIKMLDKTTVKVEQDAPKTEHKPEADSVDIIFNVTQEFVTENVVDVNNSTRATVDSTSEDSTISIHTIPPKVPTNLNSNMKPTDFAHKTVDMASNAYKFYNKDNYDTSPVRVPVNRKSHKPYKDVLSRAVKFYKDFVASTPSSYLDLNVINLPSAYKMADRQNVLFGNRPVNYNEPKQQKELKLKQPVFNLMEVPYQRMHKEKKSTKTTAQSNQGNFFSMETVNPFIKSNARSNDDDLMKQTIINNILNVIREIFPSSVNFTVVNFS